ncbi:MAG: 1-deoxy-D-xylulose-5-phosphate synthase [Deltaproteobacteria bacterium]|nr:1-deoxy-D-xylulose-5-phosphate synthase [Deltaproteobacteria bacterium]
MTTDKIQGSILETVNYPEDIRKLDVGSLNTLAEELRRTIIQTVAKTGGHLASSLGTVELTLAVHYVFNTPRDKVIWDVGHQAYAHKILTGRKAVFHTLRQKDGISGFPRREESPFDVFTVGHSGTSISAATGITEARCLKKESFKTIAIIGDGAMTTGMAFEALNWAGDRDKDLIIILNDNEVSISPNVGAMSAYLNRIMTGQTVTRLRSELKNFLKNIPGIGEQMVKFTRHIEESLKTLIIPGALFEELGFTYVGPIEGHRLDHLIRTLENVKDLSGPVLLHVLTKKGKGYKFAEEEPLRFHGVAPFDIETGRPLSLNDRPVPVSYTKMFGNTIIELARMNPRICAITAAMCDGTGLSEFAKEFPERFYDVGIAEQHAVTFAAGLASENFVPVVAIYSTFLQRAYDQILHDVSLQKIPVVLVVDRSGFVGDDGPTHHGLFDMSYLRTIPDLVVMAPKDENELQHMLKTAVESECAVAIRYPRGKGVGVPVEPSPRIMELGKGEIIREGEDLAIMAIGSTVHPALEAAERLHKENISATVINARFVKPLDRNLLCEAAEKVKKVITVEENILMGGFGSAVLELLQDNGLHDCRVARLGVRDEFVPQAPQDELRKIYGIDADGIAATARMMMRCPPAKRK